MANKKVNQINRNIKQDVKTQNSKLTKGKSKAVEEAASNYFLIPVFIILCIIPLMVHIKEYNNNLSEFSWFSSETKSLDFFLYYKQWSLILVAAVMAIITACKLFIVKSSIKQSKIFIPLAVYAFLALLSAILSDYRKLSFLGSYGEFESVFAVLGYCIIAYYSYLFVKTERDLKKIVAYLITVALIMSILGIFQFTGHDLFGTKLGYNIVVPLQYRTDEGLVFTMGKNRVYLSLYNPNYVGSFVALVLPIIMFLLFFQRRIINIILSVVAIAGLSISLFGSGSLSGFIGLGTSVLLILIFMWRYLAKRFYISIPILALCVIGLFYVDSHTNIQIVNKLMNNIKQQGTVFALKDMETKDDCVSLNYNDNIMNVSYVIKDDQTATFVIYDNNSQVIEANYDANTNSLVVTDPRFTGITLGPDSQITGIFYIQVEGKQWRFTNRTGDGTYYYVNVFNKLDKMITAPSFLFKGREHFASERGYIWSRTLPLLRKYIFLGSGPDTFTMAFPQQDYLHLAQSGFEGQILTKPHSMYLQMGVQTGLLSLIVFLIFYGIYFISSIRLYLRSRFTSFYAKCGVAIFIGTISYMVAGLANDSSITTAPFFWVLIGIGIAVNYQAKPLIYDEVSEIKLRKKEKKADLLKAKNDNAEAIKAVSKATE